MCFAYPADCRDVDDSPAPLPLHVWQQGLRQEDRAHHVRAEAVTHILQGGAAIQSQPRQKQRRIEIVVLYGSETWELLDISSLRNRHIGQGWFRVMFRRLTSGSTTSRMPVTLKAALLTSTSTRPSASTSVRAAA